MNTFYKYTASLIISFIIPLCFYGCLKDEEIILPEVQFSSSEEIIHYFEANGDFINSVESPAIVKAQDIYTNREEYLVLDIRPDDEFKSGHIDNSVNINHGNLLTVLDTLNSTDFSRVIIVSKNGQSSAYYTSLLRLYGINNVYSLKFGMAEWNRDFADDWLSATSPFTIDSQFTDIDFNKNDFSKLPAFNFDKPSFSIEDKIKERISDLLKGDFIEQSENYSNNQISINRTVFLNRNRANDYVICFGSRDAYVKDNPGISHPRGAVHYHIPPYSAFTSTNALQTLPADKKIFIYSHTGVESAFLIAYLRLLGYDAVSILYGLNTFFPDTAPLLSRFGDDFFTEAKIMNYPYIK